ncbi:hypothetical protein [Streptomyces albus]|uniref:hypothetical protein n=1 Tax=Streptomyces albus TaxID=1888 RepID=UPI00196A0509|nr:hypothetical protein [Streptomyces albus]
MDSTSSEAIRGIRTVFEAVIADGLRRESVVGATDAEIDTALAAQGGSGAPSAVREVLRLVGRSPGLWLAGSGSRRADDDLRHEGERARDACHVAEPRHR